MTFLIASSLFFAIAMLAVGAVLEWTPEPCRVVVQDSRKNLRR